MLFGGVGTAIALANRRDAEAPQPVQSTSPGLPSAELVALLQRAQELEDGREAGNWDDVEFAALLGAAALHEWAAAHPDTAADLLEWLGYYVQASAARAEIADQAAELARCHALLRAAHPGHSFFAASGRAWAHACLLAGDLQALARAIDAARLGRDCDPVEATMLAVLESRLHCQLGRLDVASRAAGTALRLAEASGDEGCLLSSILAAADVCLLDGDHVRAELVLNRLPEGDPLQSYYMDLVGVSRGNAESESRLAGLTAHPTLELRRFALAKLTQAALQRGETALAAERHAKLIEAATSGGTQGAWQSCSLAMEIALRGHLPLDEHLCALGEQSFAQLLRQWWAAPRLPGGIGFLHFDDRSTLLAGLLRVVHALQPGPAGAKLALSRVLAAQATERRNEQAIEVDELLSRLLLEDHGVLVFVPGRFESVLIAADRRDTTLHTLGSADSIREQIANIRAAAEAWRSGTTNGIDPASQQRFSDAMLPHSARERVAKWRFLTIAGAGMMDNAPIELLPDPAGSNYLGFRVAMEYMDDLAGAVDVPPLRDGLTLFAASMLAGDATTPSFRMPLAKVEACLHAHREARRRVHSILDHAATPGQVISLLGLASLTHLVGHGIVDRSRSDPSGLALQLGAGGQLWGADLENISLQGSCIVVGACNAGAAPWRRGGATLATALAGAMLARGARCVIVPTSAIDVHRHLEGMATFHAAWAAGASPGEALRRARADEELDDVARLELLLFQLHGRGW